jgi:hypothetical protein
MLRLDGNKPAATLLWQGLGEQDPGMTHDTPNTLNSVISTPVIDHDYVYGIDNDGQLRCLEAATGKQVWKTDALLKERAMYGTAFFVRNGDRYFINNDRGELLIAKLSPKGFDEIDRTKLLEPTHPYVRRRQLPNVLWTHPAYANKHIIVRNDREIVRFSLASVPVPVVIAAIAIHVATVPALILKRRGPSYREIRAASMVYPNALFIGAPAVAFRASRFASLRQHSHSAARVERTGVPSFVIGIAANRLSTSLVLPVPIIIAACILVLAIRIAIDYFRVWIVSIFADGEIRSASVIHPNAPIVSSPAVAFGTSGVAVLCRHAHSASCIDGAGVAPHIVGVAGNRRLAQRFLRDEETNTQQSQTQVKTSVLHDC